VNMAAPLSIYIKEEQRAVVRLLSAEVVEGAEIHRRLSPRFGDNVSPKWCL
jgi:hypothetical protein